MGNFRTQNSVLNIGKENQKNFVSCMNRFAILPAECEHPVVFRRRSNKGVESEGGLRLIIYIASS